MLTNKIFVIASNRAIVTLQTLMKTPEKNLKTPRGEWLSARVPAELHRTVKARAAMDGESLQGWIEKACRDRLNLPPAQPNCDGARREGNQRKVDTDASDPGVSLAKKALKLADSLPPQAASQKQERFLRAASDRVRK